MAAATNSPIMRVRIVTLWAKKLAFSPPALVSSRVPLLTGLRLSSSDCSEGSSLFVLSLFGHPLLFRYSRSGILNQRCMGDTQSQQKTSPGELGQGVLALFRSGGVAAVYVGDS